MPQLKNLQSEMDLLREKTDKDIDYSDIPETDDDWFNTAELMLELAHKQPKEKISMFVNREVGY